MLIFGFYLQTIFDLCIECAIPRCAVARLADANVRRNEAALKTLMSGESYRELESDILFVGRGGKGIALESGWGYPEVDFDRMVLYGGPLGVHIPQGLTPPGPSCLRYHPENCPPAYCKIEVTDIKKLSTKTSWWDPSCICRTDGVDWLNINASLRNIESLPFETETEYTPTLLGSAPDPSLDHYLSRLRGNWPPSDTLEKIKQLPAMFVLAGNKSSTEYPFQARLSYSAMEMLLINDVPDFAKQAFVAFKYTFKRSQTICRGLNADSDCISITGYHLKTVFMQYIEKRGSLFDSSPFKMMLDLLNELQNYIFIGVLPHYFVPECNLLGAVGSRERNIAIKSIGTIFADPLKAVITCPTDPGQIYGDIRPNDIVAVVRRSVDGSNSEGHQEELRNLLQRLDDHRHHLHMRQLQQDKANMVSGRPELRRLLSLWKQIHDWKSMVGFSRFNHNDLLFIINAPRSYYGI